MTDRRLAALLICLLLPLGACTGEELPAADREETPSESRPTGADETSGYQGRRPIAYVVASGRIAYPHLSLTTWSTCVFEIESVSRVSDSLIRVVGRESMTKCNLETKLLVVSERLTRKQARYGVEEVQVVSRSPKYVVEAIVQQMLA